MEIRAVFDQPVRPSSSGGAFMYGRLEHGGYVTFSSRREAPGGVYTIRNSKRRAGVGRDVTIRQIDTAELPVVDRGAAARAKATGVSR